MNFKKEQIENQIHDFLEENQKKINLDPEVGRLYLKSFSRKELTTQVINNLIDRDPSIFKFIPEEFYTEKLCLYNLSKTTIDSIPSKLLTPSFLVKAVKYHPENIFVIPPELVSEKVVLAAIEKDPIVFKDLDDSFKTSEVCFKAVQKDGSLIEFVKNQTLELCLESLKDNYHNIQYIHEDLRTKEVIKYALSLSSSSLAYLNQTASLCLFALDVNKNSFMHVRICPNKCYESTLKHLTIMNKVENNKKDLKKKLEGLQ